MKPTQNSNAGELMVEGRGVTKAFKDFWGRTKLTAVSALDIAVPRGVIFGLLGPNGAGKSTLIKMILGHLYPTAGTLTVMGRSPRDVEAKQRLGYLPERAIFYKQLTAEEVLRLFGELLQLSGPEIRRRSEQLLEMVGLQNARRRRVGEYSHGMARRLGLAQALLNDPDLLLLDEPTAGLDPVGCYEVKQLIQTLAARGKTILMSSHLLADVQDVCGRIMIMYGGQVQQVGAVQELLAQKDELLIRAPLADAGAIERARAALAAGGLENIAVSHPTRSLEEYFLEIVEQANRRRIVTAGAQMGRGVAEYLRNQPADAEAGRLLASLSAQEKPEAVAPAQQPAAEPDKTALDNLTAAKAPAPQDQPAAAAELDRSALDRLTQKK